MSDKLKEQKKSNGRHLFQKGQSGNPKGKPKGVGIQGELRKKLNQNLPAILDLLIQQALTGDLVAIKLLMEKGFPNKKSESFIDLDIPEDLTLHEKVDYALQAATRGELPIESAGELAKAAAVAKTLSEATGGSMEVIEVDNFSYPTTPDHSVTITEAIDLTGTDNA